MSVNKVEYFGKVLIDLTKDTVSEDTLMQGVTAHDKSGAAVTGTFTLDDEITTQDNLISAIKSALVGKAAGSGGAILTQEKTVDIEENGTVEITPDAGYALSKVTVNVQVGESRPDPSEEYQRVEYIKIDGAQYLVTDVIADNATGAELTASYPSQLDCVSMGSTTSASNTRFYLPYLLSTSSMYYGYNTGNSVTFSSSKNTKYISRLNFLNNRAAAMYDANGLAKAGQVMTRSVTQQTAPIAIGCYKSPSGRGAIRPMTIYGVRLSQGDEIIRDYVPCYRKADGVIGLYDMVTGQFLTNQGTEEFTKGEDIEW